MLGRRFGKLEVIKFSHTNKWHTKHWICLCDCGHLTIAQQGHLNKGLHQSCGCSQIRHSDYNSPTYISWYCMKTRCNNKNDPNYRNYGAKGISYDPAWQNYVNFKTDVGERPKGMTLGRKDHSQNYSKANCRWETPKQQAQTRPNWYNHWAIN